MKKGFDVHDYGHRMDLARKRLTTNRRVSPHSRLKILEFLDYLETQGISLPRRIRYLQNLSKLAAILQIDFKKATKSHIEAVMLKNERLDLADETKIQFKIMVKRFYKWLKDRNDEEYPSEVRWIKTTTRDGRLTAASVCCPFFPLPPPRKVGFDDAYPNSDLMTPPEADQRIRETNELFILDSYKEADEPTIQIPTHIEQELDQARRSRN